MRLVKIEAGRALLFHYRKGNLFRNVGEESVNSLKKRREKANTLIKMNSRIAERNLQQPMSCQFFGGGERGESM